MSDQPLDARERAELCDLFVAKGPDAPTLCEGWATLDLAAHLLVRETDLRSGLAILGGGRFASLETKLMDGARAQGYERIVERLRGGPPTLWRLPGLRPLLNEAEWFIHHEDVRRAGGDSPRTDRPDLDAALWRNVRRTARFMLRRVKGTGVALEAPGFGEVPPRGHDQNVRLVGGPQELVLYLSGRRSAAQVDITGSDEARAALESASLGL
ncbi:MAG TPA: TIGR03085 family metal-binding protein [Acidimicrobiales bacterium]